ncbi:hypothetical protein [Ostreibacterium oceani]|uniref:Uncharacterized protein n=1 Tax=Ostreibacterium oceani TaxID=2654998 RepID=A0A6N7ET15_9GAMM|nr:hypothetical protein [Ostreibacterium oceani]MPV85691.1 hypothetical protein [Ostreibacterium oceani]
MIRNLWFYFIICFTNLVAAQEHVSQEFFFQDEHCVITYEEDYPEHIENAAPFYLSCPNKALSTFISYGQGLFTVSYPKTSQVRVETGGDRNELEVTYTKNDHAWRISEIFIYRREGPDPDLPIVECRKLVDFPLDYPVMNFFDALLSDSECKTTFHIERSLDEIITCLEEQSTSGRTSSACSSFKPNYESTKRYIAYLEKYPMSAETIQQYTQMAVWLLGYELHNEAILVAANIVNYDANAAYGYFVLGRGYEALGDSAKASENYQRFVELAQSQGIDIPADIFPSDKSVLNRQGL